MLKNPIPAGTTHYHFKDEEWSEHFIKVINPNTEEEEVFVWLDLNPEWGHWSDIPVWNKEQKHKYIPVDIIDIGGDYE